MSEVTKQQAIEDEIVEIIRHHWTDCICDSGCIPPDFKIHGPRTTQVSFIPGSWTQIVAEHIRRHIEKRTTDAGEGEDHE